MEMEEGTKVRLVRCPKCANLLPENPEFSVYQCGGCGAILRTKKKVAVNVGFVERSGDEKSRGSFEKSEGLSEKGGSSPSMLNSASETERERESLRVNPGNTNGRVVREKIVNPNSVRSRTGRKEVFDEYEMKREEEIIKASRIEPSGSRKDTRFIDNPVRSYNLDKNMYSRNYVDSNMERYLGFYGNPMEVSGPGRFPSTYYEEGPSNYNNPDPLYRGYGGSMGMKTIENLERDRAELLKKLDELQIKLSRSDPDKERVIPNMPVHNVSKHPDFSEPNGTVPTTNHHHNIPNFYPSPSHVRNEVPDYYDDQFHPMMRGPHYEQMHPYSPQSQHEFFRRQMDVNPHPPVPFRNRRMVTEDPVNSNLYRNTNPVMFEPSSFHPQAVYSVSPSRNKQQHTRWPSDPVSDIGGFGVVRSKRDVVKHNGQFCHAVAGGAPFIVCNNCFELLKLPRKLFRLVKNQQKLQCGGCSAFILVVIENRKLTVSIPTEHEDSPSEIFSNRTEEQGSNVIESEKRKQKNGLNSSFEDEANPAGPAPSKEHTDCYSNTADTRYGKGNVNSESDIDDKVIFKRVTYQDNYVKDVSAATELDVSFDEYTNQQFSQDSMEVSKEEYHNKTYNEDGEPFFVEKKSFEDFSRSNRSEEDDGPEKEKEKGKGKVFINGNPMPYDVVKEAEKLAGPILPGDYWYDFHAGFWGVMGHPCLGIIPPFIEEFNYPMPTNCAAGNTGVYVNRRELHQKDLDLLSDRGLPATRDRFYNIDISGTVRDEDSGQELYHLGRLAPTIEKVKRGFGMKVPRFLL